MISHVKREVLSAKERSRGYKIGNHSPADHRHSAAAAVATARDVTGSVVNAGNGSVGV